MSETQKSIITARTTNIRTRLIGSMFLILILLPVAGILYSASFARLERAVHTLDQLSAQPEAATVEQRVAVLTELSAASQSMWEVPLAWGLVIALAVLTVTVITIQSVVQPVERLTESVRALAGGKLDERAPVEWADEFGQLATAFNEMADRLLSARAELEKLVDERTRALTRRTRQMEAAARVARESATIQDVEQLLNETVRLISEQFGFYHAGIFLLDEPREYAVLRAASSEGGQRMLARAHKLKVGEVGIVGYTAGVGEPRIALDVGADAVFFNNPDLPATRSEMALPLKVRDRVIGVLDVQSTEEGAFSQEDAAILQTMADQVAMAIENARLLTESQQTLQELEKLYGQRVREAWRDYLSAYPSAYRYTSVGVNPVTAAPSTSLADAPLPERPMVVEENGRRRLMAPILLRRQTLGFVTFQQSIDETPWSSEELALVEELCTQIGLALENARLLEATQLRAEQERIIADITSRVRASMDPEIILKTAVRELGAALSTDRAFIQLGGTRVQSDGGQGEKETRG